MSIEWGALGGQKEFDRAVEALVLRRFGGEVRAVDGRGGDDGIDIEIVEGTRRNILQLKYFPEGFSGGFKKTRRDQIEKSFSTAMEKQKPDEWTLVVPNVCTNEEAKFVQSLKGSHRVRIKIIDRDELDSWLIDDPNLDAYFQRTPINVLMQYAQVFNQEQAALLNGYPDVHQRISALASVIDSVDPLWSYGFASEGGASTITMRPRPGVPLMDAGFRVALKSGLNADQTALLSAVEEDIGYGSSKPIRIPADMVEWVGIQGPALFDGQQLPPGDVEIRLPARRPRAGQTVELRLEGVQGEDESEGETYCYDGEVKHFSGGELGSSLDIALSVNGVVVKFRFPHIEDGALGRELTAQLAYSTRDARPALMAEILGAVRHIRSAALLELYLGDVRIAKMSGKPPGSAQEYGLDKLVIEQFAHDLNIVQKHCKQYFKVPKWITEIERIDIRVARILVEGGIVASPEARVFTTTLSGEDSPSIRNSLQNPWMLAMKSAEPYAVTIGGKTLTVGQVWVIHPQATAINGEDAISALDAGNAKDFAVHLRPGDDEYFLFALADRPLEAHLGKPIEFWSLIDVEQPDADKMLEGWG